LINFDDVTFRYEPWPIGIGRSFFAPDLFDELSRTFPPRELFKPDPELGGRWSLDEYRSRRAFDDFFQTNPAWRELRRYVDHGDFVKDALAMLASHGIDTPPRWHPSLLARFLRRAKPSVSTQLLLAIMPADGGFLLPHTDRRPKYANFAIAMTRPDEWDDSLGGSTDLVRPTDPRALFSLGETRLPFDQVEVLDRLPHTPNQAVIVIRTANSWHAVSPMTNRGSPALRKTLNINILHS